ncbi:MAG TPA: hypothetical protein VFU02_17480, partial [Polyangiaceae bacterium]|nr:hypothetical protein [Polyangiaceae bacterium]
MIRSRPIVAAFAFSVALCLLPETARAQAKPADKVQPATTQRTSQASSPSQRSPGSDQDRAD